MLPIILSLTQVAMPIIASLVAATYLHEVIQRLLADLCGTEDRARFWTRCSVVAMFAAPLMLVLLVTDIPNTYTGIEAAGYTMRVLRQTLAWTAGGILAAVGVIAYVVMRYIPREIKGSTS
ncbi:MAG: hypothetical protein FWD67_03120 [Betaproteobacteria bacterium]|nr:hypothetical protein [Betaproteobacteria bacterium]